MVTNEDTIRAYEASVADYAAEAAAMPEWVASEIERSWPRSEGRAGSWRSAAGVGETRVSSSVEG